MLKMSASRLSVAIRLIFFQSTHRTELSIAHSAPAGTIGLLPVPDNQEKQFPDKLEGRLSSVEDFSNVIVKTTADGSNIYLRDVARIETGARSASMFADTNIIEEMSQNYCAAIDNTECINESLAEVPDTFKEALMLVIIIIFIFLQSWRATLIPVSAIPVSLVGTFCALLMKPHNPDAKKNFLDKLFGRFNNWFDRTQKKSASLTMQVLALALIFVFVCFAALFFRRVVIGDGLETSKNHHDFAGFYNRLLAHAVVSGMLAAIQITSAEFRELGAGL